MTTCVRLLRYFDLITCAKWSACAKLHVHATLSRTVAAGHRQLATRITSLIITSELPVPVKSFKCGNELLFNNANEYWQSVTYVVIQVCAPQLRCAYDARRPDIQCTERIYFNHNRKKTSAYNHLPSSLFGTTLGKHIAYGITNHICTSRIHSCTLKQAGYA